MVSEVLTDEAKDDIPGDMLQAGPVHNVVIADQERCGRADGVPPIQHDENPPGSQGDVVVRVGVHVGIRIRVDFPQIELHREAEPDGAPKNLSFRGAAQLPLGGSDTMAVDGDYRHDQSLKTDQIGDGRARFALGLPFTEQAACGSRIIVRFTAGVREERFDHGIEGVVECVLQSQG